MGKLGRAANDCNTFFGGFKHKSEIISITGGYVPENSSDLSSGRRPTSKSDEFSGTYPLGIELQRCQKVDFTKKWFSYWRRDPRCAFRRPTHCARLPDTPHGYQAKDASLCSLSAAISTALTNQGGSQHEDCATTIESPPGSPKPSWDGYLGSWRF